MQNAYICSPNAATFCWDSLLDHPIMPFILSSINSQEISGWWDYLFLSTEFEEKVNDILFGRYDLKCGAGVEVIYFASRILKKANIEKYGLAELAGEVGMDIKEPIGGESPDWTARLFSQDRTDQACNPQFLYYLCY